MELPARAHDSLMARIRTMANLDRDAAAREGRIVFKPFSRTGLDLERGSSALSGRLAGAHPPAPRAAMRSRRGAGAGS
jgi:hypothetical protein